MHRCLGDGPGRELEVRHATAAGAEKNPNLRTVRRDVRQHDWEES